MFGARGGEGGLALLRVLFEHRRRNHRVSSEALDIQSAVSIYPFRTKARGLSMYHTIWDAFEPCIVFVRTEEGGYISFS